MFSTKLWINYMTTLYLIRYFLFCNMLSFQLLWYTIRMVRKRCCSNKVMGGAQILIASQLAKYIKCWLDCRFYSLFYEPTHFTQPIYYYRNGKKMRICHLFSIWFTFEIYPGVTKLSCTFFLIHAFPLIYDNVYHMC